MSHPIKKIVEVMLLADFRVVVRFDDGVTKTVDLEPFLHGPIFDPLRRDPAAFRALKIDGGTLAWPNGADIDPLVLYYDDLQPAWK
ncbi:MAG: DUF2442 domain-containing protein [Opitutales bacterium]|jgi:hypothetical protein